MLYERLHVTLVGIVAMLVDSAVVAEFAGYWLDRLFHSDKFPVPSRSHLVHHSLVYGLDETELLSLRGCSKALFHREARSKTAVRTT